MLRLTSETDHDANLVPAVDTQTILRLAVHLADLGIWNQRLTLPSGARYTVRQIVDKFGLRKLVNEPERIP